MPTTGTFTLENGVLTLSTSSSEEMGLTQIGQTLEVHGSGINLGNAGGWSTEAGNWMEMRSSRRGIGQARSNELRRHAIGDSAGIYSYLKTDGGAAAQSDEGSSAASFQLNEFAGYFHGVVSSTSGKGDQRPVLVHTSGNGWVTDGAYLLSMSNPIKGSLAGTWYNPAFTTVAGPSTSWLKALPVTTQLPLSTAVGIATAPIQTPLVFRDAPVVMTVTVQLVTLSGTLAAFTAGSVVTVGGDWYPEQSILQAVGPVTAGTQTLTLKLANPHANAVVFQGGIQGKYLTFPQNLAFSGQQTTILALGSLTGTDLIYAFPTSAGVINGFVPAVGSDATSTSSPFVLYDGAEIVYAPDENYVGFTLEQNGVPWKPGTWVEQPHHPCFAGGALFLVHEQYTPSFQGARVTSFTLLMQGAGIGGVGTAAHRTIHQNPLTNFQDNGGPLPAPDANVFSGPFGHGHHYDYAPDNQCALTRVESNSVAGKVTRVYDLAYGVGGAGTMLYDPNTGRWHVDFIDCKAVSIEGAGGYSGTVQIGNYNVTIAGGIITGVEPVSSS